MALLAPYTSAKWIEYVQLLLQSYAFQVCVKLNQILAMEKDPPSIFLVLKIGNESKMPNPKSVNCVFDLQIVDDGSAFENMLRFVISPKRQHTTKYARPCR